ncbi:cob(I)yrinic acid a,c-diamide adenosyltransferase [Candidatus Woesearchaeota archaeon]|nr:cob(I)yrinic acid a,c-diamide adenosyltransferase [Candidatus Woesearchaeota archaeon]MBW2978585.1 cob(I)yrinic acid a,c-diamide adenosyltransferase [Candidatus Woesearchaeota archaeon]
MQLMKNLGLVQVYTGEGKGKTTCSLGLSLRAVGQGYKIYMIQFLKSGDTGELFSVKKYIPNMTLVQFGKEAITDTQLKMFEFDGQGELKESGGDYNFLPDQAEKEPARRALEHAFNIVNSGDYNIVILDEINCAMHKGLIEIESVLKLIDTKPENVELILTGRDAPHQIIERADLVSEIKMRKHPWEKGIDARRGIEY